ncbi:MAG: Mur ligase family protein [Candidatus Pacebacteria bacterium]|nr:Mur ligase family protein [Candidatus Paceibacterota bacterium]
MNLPKHVHVIGICGVATSALAIAFHKVGVKVTGSDKGFFPPVSTYLKDAGVEYYAGWHPENIGTPDFVMIGGTGTSPSNPETLYAKEHNIPAYSYAEVLQKYFIKKNSIVVTGTWGKTTTSALLSYIFTHAGRKLSYFTGGLSLSHPTGALSDSDWSLVEGDEYQVSISDRRPKFVYYAPTHLLLTSVSWDHADLYPTEKDYFDTFEKLVSGIPDDGLIIACIDEAGVKKILEATGKKAISYGKSESADYSYHSITYTKNGLHFQITAKDICYEVLSPMLGRFNVENITAAFAMAREAGIPADKVIDAIKEFKGIKRRFEKRFEGDVTLLDCHAPTAEKATSVLESVREVYTSKIIAVYEPNIGGRQYETAHKYDNAFKDADMVIIPRLTKLKVSEDDSTKPMEGNDLVQTIEKTHKNVKYFEDDSALVNFLATEAKKDDCIVFLGSHGFRGMIEETVNKLSMLK